MAVRRQNLGRLRFVALERTRAPRHAVRSAGFPTGSAPPGKLPTHRVRRPAHRRRPPVLSEAFGIGGRVPIGGGGPLTLRAPRPRGFRPALVHGPRRQKREPSRTGLARGGLTLALGRSSDSLRSAGPSRHLLDYARSRSPNPRASRNRQRAEPFIAPATVLSPDSSRSLEWACAPGPSRKTPDPLPRLSWSETRSQPLQNRRLARPVTFGPPLDSSRAMPETRNRPITLRSLVSGDGHTGRGGVA